METASKTSPRPTMAVPGLGSVVDYTQPTLLRPQPLAGQQPDIGETIRRISADSNIDTANWITTALRNGSTPTALAAQLVRSGHHAGVANLLTQLAARGLWVAPLPEDAATDATPRHAEVHHFNAGSAPVDAVMSMRRGGVTVALYENLVTDAEIDLIKMRAAHKMDRSKVFESGFTGRVDSVRTSRGTFLSREEAADLAALENRIANVTGIPAQNGEQWQVLHYKLTNEYKPHWDYFTPTTPEDRARLEREGGNRVGTMILYLSDVDEGGSTYFPYFDLAVHPRKGLALWFSYTTAGSCDIRSKHAGMPIIHGQKWIATKWLRERAFTPDPTK